MPSPAAAARCADELRRHCRGDVLEGVGVPGALAYDFGRMVRRPPAVVLRPETERDVTIAVRCGAEHGLPVVARGAGHSQSGQGLGAGLVLDMTRLSAVAVAETGDFVAVEAGATWHHVVGATVPRGRLPLALTHALDTTVAGTLSVGGLGAESFRYGAQIDQVADLEVVTPDGRCVRCSRSEERALFDAVRGGLGQCGVIVRARYPLRACSSRVLTRCFAFGDPGRYLSAAHELAARSSVEWLAGALRPAQPGAPPRLFLLVGEELDERSEGSTLPDLTADFENPPRVSPLWHDGRALAHPFFRRFGPANATNELHPWIDHLFGERDALGALEAFVPELADVVPRGSANLLFLRRGADPAPLLPAPAGEVVLGLSALSVFDEKERSEAARGALAYAERAALRGGLRYLSGYLGPVSPEAWERHYGAAWLGFKAAKQRYDPGGVLNPGLIAWGR